MTASRLHPFDANDDPHRGPGVDRTLHRVAERLTA